MKKPIRLFLIAALTLSLSFNGTAVLAKDGSAPDARSAVTERATQDQAKQEGKIKKKPKFPVNLPDPMKPASPAKQRNPVL